MKDLRWLALFVIMALLVACDLRPASAPPLALPLVQATALPHDPPAQPIVKPRRIPDGLRIEGAVPPLVLDRFYALAYMYPDVANKTKRIVARRAGGKGWAVSYERTVIYVNVDKGEYLLADTLTDQFARRAFDYLKRTAPNTAKSFRTAKRLGAWLRSGVR
jgi:hypothetical protein